MSLNKFYFKMTKKLEEEVKYDFWLGSKKISYRGWITEITLK